MSLLGLNGVSIDVRIIWYQSLGSKIRFTIILPFCFLLSSYLVSFVFFIPCLCFVSCTSFFFFKKKSHKKRIFFDVLFFDSLFL
jgi:hypothetical protein